ncbi:hydrogenase nickel incorporation protein HypB [Butyrivibrio fibrisolvens DSM 3071]|uniref:Hydrogenase nickel incorporation protein HypB n=1 Tax=Butyrivibrio fibrisolvens DSM 3071 TaxID=1121131 RepID=A0A1M5YIH1_BUTFI|nr:hydrogenase nickel incorporation protein HypB [Butyrivibrio fibrisolvens]SHI11820.1 hydrogenase nickel incorporation protein HypB [Butyrivibrio fibrisolvens DSM 3071]
MSDRSFEILETKERVIADNDAEAAKVRELLKKHNIFLVNLMASPGAGKTTTLVRTINALKDKYRIGVMEADVDSDVDARTVAEAGAKVIQLHTGGSCHMDADMTRRGLEGLGLDDVDVVFLENVGNLVCPAEFDVGANKRVMILSVPEGDDKPLKYPLMFTVSDCMLIGKIDVAPVFDFDYEACKERVLKLNPDMKIIKVSSLKGDGFEEWIEWLTEQIEMSR